jgi:hypothetical protein
MSGIQFILQGLGLSTWEKPLLTTLGEVLQAPGLWGHRQGGLIVSLFRCTVDYTPGPPQHATPALPVAYVWLSTGMMRTCGITASALPSWSNILTLPFTPVLPLASSPLVQPNGPENI